MKRAAIVSALALATVAVTAAAQQPAPRPGGHFLERFQAADTDRNGAISLPEAEANLPRIARDFAAIDANHDGLVTLEELKAAHQQARARRLQAVDTNGDGRISRDEFLAQAAKRFDRLDVNHDGFLAPEEMKRGHHRGAALR